MTQVLASNTDLTGLWADPRDAVDELAACTRPYLLGVRHHSPAVAAAVPALLDAAGVEVVCVELPADFQHWLPYLAHPDTHAPVALAGAGDDGRLAFYPFADFSPELAAVRWARDHGVEVLCCDLPMSDRGWSDIVQAPSAEVPAPDSTTTPAPAYADGLSGAGTGRDGDDLWDRAVEVLAPGCAPEAVRRAALGVGWALRQDAANRNGVEARDLAREAHMRRMIAAAAAGGRRVAAIIGSFHAPALATIPDTPTSDTTIPDTPTSDTSIPAPTAPETEPDQAAAPPLVTSLVPYAFDLLDSRSGYPAGIRDPQWQQAVFTAGGNPEHVRDAAATVITDLCRALRAAGHTAGTGEAAETLRIACDLARLRTLPAPGRGELLEAVTTVLGQGEPLGRGRALARALDTVMVGSGRGRTAPGTPRSGLAPAVEAELAELRLPDPDDPAAREVRLDPLRSALDARREILLQRLSVCGAGYGEPTEVAGTGDGIALTTRWRLAWSPAVPARLDLAGVRGVTAAQAAAGTLREQFRRESADGGATCALVLGSLRAAARCDLPDLVADRLADAAAILPASATLPELLGALDLLEALRRQHLPGTTEQSRAQAAALTDTLLEAAIRMLPGLAGSDDPADAAALVALAGRAAEQRLGLRLDDALAHLARTGSPLIRGAALAVRVLLDLGTADELGARAAGWIDAATALDTRRRLSRLLAGLLSAAGPLMQSAPAALDPVLDRIDSLTDEAFLARLPALRGGFDTLTPAARDQLLRTVTERLGDRLDLRLSASPKLMARWAAADAAGLAALRTLRIPLPETLTTTATADQPPDSDPLPATPSTPDPVGDPKQPQPQPQPRSRPQPSPSTTHSLSPADRWRLLLGRESTRLPDGARRYAHALDELYGAGRGEGTDEIGGGPNDPHGAGQGASFPTAREWAQELDALFGAEVREEVLGRAAESGRGDVLAELDPGSVRPSVDLLTAVLNLAGGMPEQQLAKLRPLVRRLVDELARELATKLRPAMTGLATPRPTRRPGGRLDLPRTLRANLVHTRRLDDGRTVVVPERPIFSTRARRQADWRLILVVDVSGSMEASVVWSALTAAVLGGVPSLSTHFLAFSTEVIDLTDRVSDPLSLLLEVQVGGGTHIAAGLAHARTLVTVPSRTLVAVVSDFEEGYPLGGLLAEVRGLAGSGVHLMGCAALDDTGTPRYSVPVAQQLVAAGMPVAALSPIALARWVGDRLRGERP
ncbi:MAG TPA: DUF5682 family protein [Actinocrinis sp.]|uniref:vWA domain-containing protein n=1 Tax=Actinocrinis sp. TaxID=1920516 RepID=UPI002DDD7C97|nr:DUF5682 family protein [Actinocrinis sp.]HEV2343674.1 DUF5682 family protein [Actinocrinis sp.]